MIGVQGGAERRLERIGYDRVEGQGRGHSNSVQASLRVQSVQMGNFPPPIIPLLCNCAYILQLQQSQPIAGYMDLQNPHVPLIIYIY